MPLYPPASGGSGNVATDTIWDAKGDLAAGTGANTASRLAVGSDGKAVGADANESTGLAYYNPWRRNYLLNSSPEFAQRVVETASTAMSDNAYNHFDRWLSLIQGSNPTITRVTGSDGTAYAGKMTAGGTTNRFGLAQWIKSTHTYGLRSKTVRFQVRIRPNRSDTGSETVRCALLEWTGTADTPSTGRDVVNDWTSGTFTAGNFFKSTTTNVIAVSSAFSLAHNTWADVYVTGTVGGSANNLIAFFWNVNAPGNAANYLEWCKAGLYEDAMPAQWVHPDEAELNRCRHYCLGIKSSSSATRAIVGNGLVQSTTVARVPYRLPVEMRTIPTLTATASEWDMVHNSGGSIVTTALTALILSAVSENTSDTVNFDATIGSASLTNGEAVNVRADNTADRIMYLDAEI